MTEILGYTACRQLSQMFLATLFFHTSEYIILMAIHGRSNETLSSVIINTQYILEMMFSLAEYVFEIVFFPHLKEYWVISNAGLAMVLIGEVIRKLAILTAGHAYTYRIRIHQQDDHHLITHGIYRFMRHPGYTGFLIWYVGAQIMLCNPISAVAFAVVVWRAFARRIAYEENFLRRFFERDYEEYARKVGSGIPFIN